MLRSGRSASACSAVLAALALAALAGVGAGISAHAEESWQVALRLQLDEEKRCRLEAYISVRELPADAVGGIEGRIRCVDGREFDFTRPRTHQKFDIRLCQPAVC